ncbi:hypothetical protein A2V49_00790 [candidate division WWE3 bacterium RBG_19FT_COMBO_34_6]|uniref:Uncharacterized protein n=1 Tax=candidate division WWE3 bacterium RBG_19FT_COMBO_34_6 TaxID=1802612 RepID=A0A1F4UKD7_UNCKA|nr:MAG: hypothetical protein A2V49_00790 [candidate division WWE3 bacterium RBG_19FT_COMBO_34_6]
MSNDTIIKRLKILSDLQEEVNKAKALCDESLENDATFQQAKDEATKVRDEAKVQKEKILGNSVNREIMEKIKELQTEIKENREVLAQELADYYKESGKLEIVDNEGNTKKIKFSARLISG